jgi:hypothetical protein
MAKNGDCAKLVGDVVGRIEPAGNYGHYQLRTLFEVRNPDDGVEGYGVSGVMGVCKSSQQRGQSICSKASEIPGSWNGCIWPVGIIHQPTQIVESRHCSWSEDSEGKFGSDSEAWVDYPISKLSGRRKWGSSKSRSKRSFPSGRVKRDPFYKEWERSYANLDNSVRCLFAFGGWGGGSSLAQHCNPVTEGMSVVGGFTRRCVVCEIGSQGEPHANNADEECPPLSHAQTMQREETSERAN